jgi:exodeoxyribonuclease VII large subunit
VDFTIVDFVADMRAPTPSAAAEIVTPNIEELLAEVRSLQDQLYGLMENRLDEKRSELSEMQRRLKQASPAGHLPTYRQRLDDLTSRANRGLSHRLELQRSRVSAVSGRLKVLDPNQILERGYAIVTQANGQVVTNIAQAQPGEKLEVRVSDGQFKVEKL